MSNNRDTVYKNLLKEYSRKANANQKPKVKELLNLYKTGKVFSKVTIRKELNRYLGRHANETARDLQLLTTMVKSNTNTVAPSRENKKLEKQFETTLKKFEHVQRYRENHKFVKVAKITDEIKNDRAFKTHTMQLNTKMAFPAKIFKLLKEGDKDTLELYYYHPDKGDDNKTPHKDTIYLHIKPKVERVVSYRLIDVLKENKSIKVSVGMKFDTFIIRNAINAEAKNSDYVYVEEKLIAKKR